MSDTLLNNVVLETAQEADDEIKQLRIQVKQADERGDEAMRQKHYLHDIVRWAYERLQPLPNSNLFDEMMYDRVELWLNHGKMASQKDVDKHLDSI